MISLQGEAKTYQTFCNIGVSLILLYIAHEITKSFILSRSTIIRLTVPTYDFDQGHWKKIYGPEVLNKIGELLTGIPADEIIPTNNKPAVRIRRTNKK